MMPFLLADNANLEHLLPLYVLCVGSHEQKEIDRMGAGYAEHQLFLIRRGKGILRMSDGQEYALTEGMAFLLPAHQGHGYWPDPTADQWELGYVAFGGDAADQMLARLSNNARHEAGSSMDAAQKQQVEPIAIHAPNFAALWLKLEGIWHTIHQERDHAYNVSGRLYDLLLAWMSAQYPATKLVEDKATLDAPYSALKAALRWIHDHLGERLLLSNVARAAGYSSQHFHRLFVANYGMTPQQYILQLRMSRALQLFTDDPDITVERVAERVGMETSYFIRMFRRKYGTTPKRYVQTKHGLS